MKTYKNIYGDLCSQENILLAFKKARKGKTKMLYVKRYEENLKKNLLALREELLLQTYKPSPLKKCIIRDPKTRTIYKSIFKDRIVHHVIINVLKPIFEPIFICDTYASIKNRGYHKALARFDYFKRKVSKNNTRNCYVLKVDIKHYFQEIDHEILLNMIRRKIKDAKVVWLIKQILENYDVCVVNYDGKGMPLGNYTSQFLANVYLNGFDYFIKNKLKVKYYIRYVDDFVLLHNSIEQLELWKMAVNSFLKRKLHLELHQDKSKIINLINGISLLGFKVFYNYKLLKKSNVNQIKRNVKEWNCLLDNWELFDEKVEEKLQGWIAHAKHGNTYKLRKEVIDSLLNS